MIVLKPKEMSIEAAFQLLEGESFHLCRSAQSAVLEGRKKVEAVLQGKRVVYGLTTGFGKLGNVLISSKNLQKLQENLVLSHCSGVGKPLSKPVVRLVIGLKLLSLGQGLSGVRWEVLEGLEKLVTHHVHPLIPSRGSVGASGDLAPLAHLAAVLIGHGYVLTENNDRLPAEQALKACGLSTMTLYAKEGLALINGTEVSTALVMLALKRTDDLLKWSVALGALSVEGVCGADSPFQQEALAPRTHEGQQRVGKCLFSLLQGSAIRESHRHEDTRVQDPYSLRCMPQVLGASWELLQEVRKTLETELNSVTDNPVLVSDGIASEGNFHGQYLGFAADKLALALSTIGTLSQRHSALLVDPSLNYGLPAFLAPNAGLNCGFMMAEVTTAALMAENRHLASPCSLDTTPTSAYQEDHVSMSAGSALRLQKMLKNLSYILAIEWMMGVQAVELRSPLTTSPPVQKLITHLRSQVPFLKEDRYMATDIKAAQRLLWSAPPPNLPKDLL